uniref:Reverse transcriptase Ty1/copia-type domain-containing protein n=1 Tax=Chromera velia CCMP2878 TaxID=1169474 RepID=A0A0G4HHL4_9ALVE|eukprot:Cvel_27528.t1-p1 / transcript=Cvel_27528.t1 / gene=Cvel_27528 / organism=Chromera_velia_CCMP2878 / gene_product=hypothetical protein / transcript_product=hypothetical protein / location=Cvel_scaffold3451:2934-13343(+) / protein_length=697 / sequence_SO=supercontig / SO=protein_coding / is_pseudo=false
MGSSKAEEVGCKAGPRYGAGARCETRLGCRAGEGYRAGVHCRAGEGCRAGERYRAGEECGVGEGCRARLGYARARAEIQRTDGTLTGTPGDRCLTALLKVAVLPAEGIPGVPGGAGEESSLQAMHRPWDQHFRDAVRGHETFGEGVDTGVAAGSVNSREKAFRQPNMGSKAFAASVRSPSKRGVKRRWDSSGSAEDSRKMPRLKQLDKVEPLKLKPADPKVFVPLTWVDKTTALTEELMERDDTQSKEKAAPIAVVRFSYGGKTRALKELAKRLHARKIPVIFVSFNDEDGTAVGKQEIKELIERKEGDGLLKMLLERIAWTWIRSWGVNKRTVLLIDKLNVLLEIGSRHLPLDACKAAKVTLFASLKEHFLISEGRLFAFTSHVFTLKSEVASGLDMGLPTGRTGEVQKLPLLESMEDARQLWQGATPAAVVFYGRSPGLVFHDQERENGADGTPFFDHREGVTTSCATASQFAIRIALTMAFAHSDFDSHEIVVANVKTAYLTALRSDSLYVHPPKDHPDHGKFLWLLNRTLYGLRDSENLWDRSRNKTLAAAGWVPSSVRGMWWKWTGKPEAPTSYLLGILPTFVNDFAILPIGRSAVQLACKIAAKGGYQIKITKPKNGTLCWAGVGFNVSQDSVHIHQTEYLLSLPLPEGMGDSADSSASVPSSIPTPPPDLFPLPPSSCKLPSEPPCLLTA